MVYDENTWKKDRPDFPNEINPSNVITDVNRCFITKSLTAVGYKCILVICKFTTSKCNGLNIQISAVETLIPSRLK